MTTITTSFRAKRPLQKRKGMQRQAGISTISNPSALIKIDGAQQAGFYPRIILDWPWNVIEKKYYKVTEGKAFLEIDLIAVYAQDCNKNAAAALPPDS